MNRDILFRGKRVDNGEWIYGYYVGPVALLNTHEICDISDCVGTRIDVDPTTVGQYTGLTDKNGVKIFEGDIIHAVTPNTSKNFCVKFEYGQFCVGINMPISYVRHSAEVIGNIHNDNPEILGGNDGTTDKAD